MKRKFQIMHRFVKKEHLRVFRPFASNKSLSQVACAPTFVPKNSIGLPVVHTHPGYNLKYALKDNMPHVLTQCNNSTRWHNKLRKYGVGIVYIGHGVWDDSPVNARRSKSDKWKSYDLLFGGLPYFKELLVNHSGVKPQNIYLNCLPQLDALYSKNQNRFAESKDIASGYNKLIVLFGHKHGNSNFLANSCDFYKAAIALGNIARDNNWLLVIKPKKDDTFRYINAAFNLGQDWALEIKKDFLKLKNNPNVRFVSPYEDPYRYIVASDLVVLSARSTVEIESCLVNKPVVAVRTVYNSVAEGNDRLRTIENGCCYLLEDLNYFKDIVEEALFSENKELTSNQNNYIHKLGISFDGLHHDRVLSIIKERFL